jgi:hypothetical protein
MTGRLNSGTSNPRVPGASSSGSCRPSQKTCEGHPVLGGFVFMESQERWMPVVGFEDRYEVSDHGRVQALFSYRGYKPGRIVAGYATASGHIRVNLRLSPGSVHRRFVHRLVLEAFVGPCPEGMECLHGDSNPANNRLDNLRWGTHAENIKDWIMNGSTPIGERNPSAKLSAVGVQDIRRRVANGESKASVARRYGLGATTVWNIVNGNRWASIPLGS